MMRAQTHLFGSIDGYRTLARTPGVQDADAAALAALGFGSPRFEAEIELLSETPCMAGRRLPTGRYAITRVFPGSPDVAGRGTIERRTLILECAQWEELACSDLTKTLGDERNWDRTAFAEGRAVELHLHEATRTGAPPTEAELRVFDAFLTAHESGRCAVLPCVPRWSDAVLRVASLLPPSEAMSFGWGVGMWALPAGVSVATIRPDVATRVGFEAATIGGWRHPERVAQLGMRARSRSAADGRRRAGGPRPAWLFPWLVGGTAALAAVGGVLWLASRDRADPPDTSTARPPVAAPVMQPSVSPPVRQRDASDLPPPAPVASATSSDSIVAQASPPATEADLTPPSTSITGAVAGSTSDAARSSDPSDPPNDRAFGIGVDTERPTDRREQPSRSRTEGAAAPVTPPAPLPPPNIPVVVDSTPWDTETRLLERAIELSAKASRAESTQQAREVLDEMGKLANEIRDCTRHLDPKDDKLRVIIRFNPHRNRATGIPDAVMNALEGTESTAILRRVLVLAARFEISISLHDHLESKLDHRDVPGELKALRTDSGWPNGAPVIQWFDFDKSSKGALKETPGQAAAMLADKYFEALSGKPGAGGVRKLFARIRARWSESQSGPATRSPQ